MRAKRRHKLFLEKQHKASQKNDTYTWSSRVSRYSPGGAAARATWTEAQMHGRAPWVQNLRTFYVKGTDLLFPA